MRRWLKLDAQNRSFRTLLQGVFAVVIVPALVAVFGVIQQAIEANGISGVDWNQVGDNALKAGLTAAVMAVLAYVHRLKVDPSVVPSAQPPRPAGVTEMQAPATAPAAPVGK